jgi:hypothetical protein
VATQNETLKNLLLPLFDAAGADPIKLQRLIAQHYDELMSRVSGWYKRRTQLWVLLTAVIVVGAGNIDAIAIATGLYREPLVRAQTVAIAGALATTAARETAAGASAYQDSLASLRGLSLPMGWEECPGGATAWALKIVGLLVTVLALTLGAPFWFDVLSKAASLRSAGPRPVLSDAPSPKDTP